MLEEDGQEYVSDVDNASDEKAIKEKDRKSRREQKARDEALKVIMDTANGRTWMWDLLSRCNMFRTSFSENANITFFNEGMRNIGLMLTADILRVSSDNYIGMLKENGDNT